MVNRSAISIENNFIGGLKTEYTALNFPENACTFADNTVFSIIGEVDRRGGFDFEANFGFNVIGTFNGTLNVAQNTYKWNNVAGDGETQIVVVQEGSTLYFFRSSSATITNPLSRQLLGSTVNVASFLATNAVIGFDNTIECTFADGNGFLFVFHPQCDPFYVTYSNGVLTATRITIQTRDFIGVPDGMQAGSGLSIRPTSLSTQHQYNLVNQGWSNNAQANSTTTNTIGTGSFTWSLTGLNQPFIVGNTVIATGFINAFGSLIAIGSITGTVAASSSTALTITETSNTGSGTSSFWYISASPQLLEQWNNVNHNYPANCDQWWSFLDTNVNSNTGGASGNLGGFNPALANSYVLATNTQAPQGSVILNTFVQQRTTLTGIPNLTDITTVHRPTNGAWFAGRIFFTGVNDSFQATGTAPYTTWTENIYFSQIITAPQQFGYCYQQNDPTSQTLFDLLPDDGGVIVVQGSGAIYKLVPVQNGLLVFAANGIWFITGSQGIGFAANDYTVTKISGIQSISSTSYVNVLGWPVFWNEEGIYQVQPSQQGGGLQVNNLCLGTILSFYNDIPLQSKKFARGDYNPITFVIQWIYKTTNETSVSNRYQFDGALNLNTYKAPFYPYTINALNPYVSGINYVAGPGGSGSPEPVFKYLTTLPDLNAITFSEENDFTDWVDWNSSGVPQDYISTFTTGYKLHGQMQRQFGIEYIYVFSNNDESAAYSLQSLWDFSSSGNSGKWSAPQVINNNIPNFGNVFRRLRLRGHGLACQLKFTSISGQPFNFVGWSILENQSGNV